MRHGTRYKAANFVKIAQGIRPCRTFVFRNLEKKKSVKFSVVGSYSLIVAPLGVKFEDCTEAKFHPVGAMCRPCGAKNLKLPSEYLKYQHFALRAMLPVTKWLYCVECPQYSILFEALGYLCDSCLLRAFDATYNPVSSVM